MTYNQLVLVIYLSLILVMTLVAIAAYNHDKNLAIKGKERMKEKTLLFLAVFFGAFGSLVGRIFARHKTDKPYFSIVIYYSLLLQVIALIAISILAI